MENDMLLEWSMKKEQDEIAAENLKKVIYMRYDGLFSNTQSHFTLIFNNLPSHFQ